MATTKKTNRITLNLGFETFELYFPELDDTVQISFNPADEDLPRRLFEARNKIDESIKEIPKVEGSEDDLDPDSYVEAKNKVNEVIFSAIDYAFGAPISKNVFKHCSPMSIVGANEPFVFHFLEQLAPFIEKIVKEKNEKSSAYIQKKYGKYIKK